jgi:hypothetical protein
MFAHRGLIDLGLLADFFRLRLSAFPKVGFCDPGCSCSSSEGALKDRSRLGGALKLSFRTKLPNPREICRDAVAGIFVADCRQQSVGIFFFQRGASEQSLPAGYPAVQWVYC